MEITLRGTQKELETISGMIDQPRLAAAIDGEVTIHLALYRPGEIIQPKGPVEQRAGKTRKPAKRKKEEEMPDTVLLSFFERLGPSAQDFVACLAEAGEEGKTEADLRRCLDKKSINPVRGQVSRLAQRSGIPLDQLLVSFTQRNKLRFALTEKFAAAVDEATKDWQ